MTAFDTRPDSFGIDRLIRQRAATARFDPDHRLSEVEIKSLVELGTRAPSAFNLQNWRIDAVRSSAMKKGLRDAAWGQAKVEEATVTFVVSGEDARASDVMARLEGAVGEGLMTRHEVAAWTEMARAAYRDNPGRARDEGLLSATFLAATLMFAAEGRGLSTAPMSGFDPDAVSLLLELPARMRPVVILAVGRGRPDNWPQKPRRPLAEVFSIR